MITVSLLNEFIFMLLGIMIGNLGKFIKLLFKAAKNAFLVSRYRRNDK